MIHVHFLFLFILFGMSCSEPELALDNELDPGNPDFIPPETSIISPVDGTELNQHSQINVIWEGNADDMEFQYSLDDDDWSDWSSLTVTTLNYLDEGSHTFLVRGRYLSGFEEAFPDTLNFEVDAVEGPSLRIFPLLTEISNGEQFNVEIWAEEVVNIAAMEIVLRYDMQMLDIAEENITIGDFFSANDGSILNFSSIVEQAGFGLITIDIGVYSGVPEFVSGSGPVISINPTAITSGETDLEFLENDISLRQVDNSIIEIEDAVNGKVVIE